MKKTMCKDGGLGKCSSPHITAAKLQLQYKTNVTKNHQKIKLYGSLTTKELKKPHSSR